MPLLEANPHLNAVTLVEELERLYPQAHRPNLLRTLQRRVRQWRARHGEEREVYFAQEHPPGRLGLSDFTDAKELSVTIGGELFVHIIYQFALAHSGWRYASVLTGGESFGALSEGLQRALWRLGGAPEEHRTDSLSAAFKNLKAPEREDVTARYEALCAHYHMRPSRCNRGESHENGSIESRHNSLKTKINQVLLLRGSRDFADRAAYETFIEGVVQRLNARIDRRALETENAALRPLPPRRTAEFDELPSRVSKCGIFTIKGAQYSAPSRLIGHRLMVRRYAERIESYVGGTLVFECPRAQAQSGDRHARCIDYRHLITGLKRKPGAFARWVHRDEAFPRPIYRHIWERLQETLAERQACKIMVGLLALAADGQKRSSPSNWSNCTNGMNCPIFTH